MFISFSVRGVERGSAQRTALKGRERSIVIVTNTGTVSKCMGKNLKDKVKFIWSLLSTQIQSWTEPSWPEQEFILKELEMNLYGKGGACSLDIVFPLSQTEFHLKEFDIKLILLWVLFKFWPLLLQWQHWGNFWGTGGSAYGLSWARACRVHLELNWPLFTANQKFKGLVKNFSRGKLILLCLRDHWHC